MIKQLKQHLRKITKTSANSIPKYPQKPEPPRYIKGTNQIDKEYYFKRDREQIPAIKEYFENFRF